MTMGADMQELVEGAHLLDGYLLTGFLPARLLAGTGLPIVVGERTGLQQAQIRVVPLCQPAAGRAVTTGAAGFAEFLAEQRGGEGACQFELAYPALTGNQQCVW